MSVYVICSKYSNIKAKSRSKKGRKISAFKKLRRQVVFYSMTLCEFIKREAVYPSNDGLTKLYSVF